MKRMFQLFAIIIIVMCLLCACSVGSSFPTETKADELPIDPYERGIKHLYKVGEDINAGLYLASLTDGSIASYCIASDPDCDDILSNGHFHERSYIEVNDGEYLDTSFCDIIPFSDAEPYQASNGIIDEGQYLVGFDIAPGAYRLIGTGTGDAGRYTISYDANGDRIADENTFVGYDYVTVYNGEYLELSNCVIEL